jgi:hypothetical protein
MPSPRSNHRNPSTDPAAGFSTNKIEKATDLGWKWGTGGMRLIIYESESLALPVGKNHH